MRRLCYLALAVFFCAAEEQTRVLQPAEAPEIVATAELAVAELLSTDKIYTTLRLAGIDAGTISDVGYNYTDTQLTLRLASPHFKSKLPEERFLFTIMQHKTEDIKK
jgi:hypothetical protein